jgi:hypothetical protein
LIAGARWTAIFLRISVHHYCDYWYCLRATHRGQGERSAHYELSRSVRVNPFIFGSTETPTIGRGNQSFDHKRRCEAPTMMPVTFAEAKV